ncbi:hypothetical protein Hanom_Chr03g00276611 [Helianthus anomalus]
MHDREREVDPPEKRYNAAVFINGTTYLIVGVRHVYEPPGAPVAPLDGLCSVPEKDKRLPLYKEGKRYDEGKHSRTLFIKYSRTSFIPITSDCI